MTNIDETNESPDERAHSFSIESTPGLRPAPFLSALSHELCTPLGSVLMLSEMMEDQADDDPARARQVQMIRRSALDMQDLIDQVSLLARIEGGRLQVDKAEVSAEVLAGDLEREFRDRGQDVQIDLAPDAPTSLVTDLEKLVGGVRRLLAGVVNEGTAARVAIECDPGLKGGLLIRVWRPASGVKEEQLGLIFEPFHPVARMVSRSHGGQSLELTIARALVELLGGAISAALGADGAVVFSLDPG